MHVVVIGGGVAGILSAYYLQQAGFKVTVLEKNEHFGAEASGGNANQLSYSLIFPPISPDIISKIPKILMRQDPGIQFERLCDAKMLGWIAKAFPSIVSRRVYHNIAIKLMELHGRSRILMDAFLARHPDIDFDHRPCGRLQLYKTQDAVDDVYAAYQREQFGGSIQKLQRSELAEVEPSLDGRTQDFAGGLFIEGDQVADCESFTQKVAAFLQTQGVEMRTSAEVDALKRDGRSIRSVTLAGGEEIEADCFVMASGYQAARLLNGVGVRAPIYPVKGYTYEVKQDAPFKMSVVDTSAKLVLSPLTGRFKASSGVFFGVSNAPHEAFLKDLRSNAQALYPELDFGAAVLRSGYRPWTPNSLPIVEHSSYTNLYLNVGHGMLGWTIGHASAEELADIVTEGTA